MSVARSAPPPPCGEAARNYVEWAILRKLRFAYLWLLRSYPCGVELMTPPAETFLFFQKN